MSDNKTACRRCSDSDYLRKLFTPVNNPRGHRVTHGRDFGKRSTIEGLVESLIEASRAATVEDQCDLLDREFLFGCWGNELEGRSPDLIRDLRGLILSLARKAAQ